MIVSVSAGELVTETIVINPLDGIGSLTVDIIWPAGVLTDPAVTAYLVPAGETLDEAIHSIAVSLTSTTATLLEAAIPTGYYTLFLTLTDQLTTV